ncbi:MAG: MFS transporter [Limosilactobacillus mucosae]
MLVVISSWSLWQQNDSKTDESKIDSAGIKETIKQPGVMATLLAFFAYSAGEATCFLWVPSYFAGTRTGISSELVASFGSLIFGGLMIGRLIAGFIANRLGDRRMIRSGTMMELIGILLTALPIKGYLVAAIGFLIIGIGMGPIYPSIQHMAPINFGKRYSAAVIGLQMAFAYTGSTFMPTVFGILQQKLGIWIMPLYLLVFAGLSFALLELSYRQEARL